MIQGSLVHAVAGLHVRSAGRRWGWGEAWLSAMLKGQSGLHVPSVFILAVLISM